MSGVSRSGNVSSVDRAQLLLADLDLSKMQQLTHRKSATTSVAAHPSLDGIARETQRTRDSAVDLGRRRLCRLRRLRLTPDQSQNSHSSEEPFRADGLE